MKERDQCLCGLQWGCHREPPDSLWPAFDPSDLNKMSFFECLLTYGGFAQQIKQEALYRFICNTDTVLNHCRENSMYTDQHKLGSICWRLNDNDTYKRIVLEQD